MTSNSFTQDQVTALDTYIHETLSITEHTMPLTLQVLCFHLLHHICRYIEKYGTVSGMWMAYVERYNNYLSGLILNRRHPEESIAAAYQLAEFGKFTKICSNITGDIEYDSLVAHVLEETAREKVNNIKQCKLSKVSHKKTGEREAMSNLLYMPVTW